LSLNQYKRDEQEEKKKTRESVKSNATDKFNERKRKKKMMKPFVRLYEKCS